MVKYLGVATAGKGIRVPVISVLFAALLIFMAGRVSDTKKLPDYIYNLVKTLGLEKYIR